jgi:hypothetical protein
MRDPAFGITLEPVRETMRLMAMRLRVSAVGLLLLPVLAACSTSGEQSPTPTVLQTGTLTGRVLMFGGPAASQADIAAANAGRPMVGQAVTVQVNHRSVVVKTSDAAGRFSFELNPGSYMLGCPGGYEAFVIAAGQKLSMDCAVNVA